jgi:putative transcriptional regulator
VAASYNKTVFSIFVEAARAELGWDQTELASAMGVTQQSVSKWETGESRPRPQSIPRLADVLGIDSELALRLAGYLPIDDDVLVVSQNLPDGRTAAIRIEVKNLDREAVATSGPSAIRRRIERAVRDLQVALDSGRSDADVARIARGVLLELAEITSVGAPAQVSEEDAEMLDRVRAVLGQLHGAVDEDYALAARDPGTEDGETVGRPGGVPEGHDD